MPDSRRERADCLVPILWASCFWVKPFSFFISELVYLSEKSIKTCSTQPTTVVIEVSISGPIIIPDVMDLWVSESID